MDPTIFVIDDDLEMQNSLRWLMKSVKLNIEVFDDAHGFLKKYDGSRNGCILLDVRMPGMSGLELLDILKGFKNRLPVIVITAHGDIPMAIRVMKAGATDFILKPFNTQQLVDQIQKVVSQNIAQSKSLEEKVLFSNFSTLTAREKEIMNLVVEAKLNKEIAKELNIAVSTVEYHRARVMKKMQAKNVAQLVQMKMNLGSYQQT